MVAAGSQMFPCGLHPVPKRAWAARCRTIQVMGIRSPPVRMRGIARPKSGASSSEFQRKLMC